LQVKGNNLRINFDGFVKSPKVRHSGFRRNDVKGEFLTFYEAVKDIFNKNMSFKRKYWLGILLLTFGTVFVDIDFKAPVWAQAVGPMPKKSDTISNPIRESKGVDVSGLTNVDSIGFLSRKKVESWGYIFSSETGKILLCEGDTVYILVEKEHHIKHGDLFTIYHESPLLKHPLTKKKLGYTISFLGRAVIKDQVKDQEKGHLHIAEIVETYKGVRAGDSILPYGPISPCIQPLSLDSEITTNIVAVKDQHELISRFSVVYVACGYNHGIRKGNLFEIVRKTSGLPDIVLGHLLVLEVRPDTAACVVVDSKKEFPNGAHIKSINWTKAQSILSTIPECRVE